MMSLARNYSAFTESMNNRRMAHNRVAEFCKDETMGALLYLLLVNDHKAVGVPVEQLDSVATAIAVG